VQWIVPGEPFPSKPGYLMRALESLKTEVWIAWWRAEKSAAIEPIDKVSGSDSHIWDALRWMKVLNSTGVIMDAS
jgi:hypothetical protein